MRLIVRLLAAVAVTALAIGGGWAFAARNDGSVSGPVILLLAGTFAALAATALCAVAERRLAGLVADPGERLPLPAWWAPVGAAGLMDLVGAAFVSLPVAIVGALLVVAAAAGLGLALRRPLAGTDGAGGADGADGASGGLDRPAVRAARYIRDFAARHAAGEDAGVDAVIEHLGRSGARIVLLGRDGVFGDVTVRTVARAEHAVRLAGATRHDAFPAELVGRVRTGPYEWERMAGTQLGGPRQA